MRKALRFLITIAVIGAGVYYFRAPISSIWGRFAAQYLPCKMPIAYSLGTFDTEFGISQADFLADVAKAEAIWETPISKELFVYDPDGDLKINLIYDYRQEATAKLKKLGVTVDSTRASYDSLKAQYDTLQAQYKQESANFEAQVAAFNRDQDAYSAEVKKVNGRGGASKQEFARLNAQRDSLQARADQLKQAQASLNEKVDTINSLAAQLNSIAGSLNLDVAKFNEIGAQRGEEFDEGLYTSDASGRKIDIFEYSSKTKLIRVLAHEFGHALSLEHVEDAQAIMYRLNQGTTEKLTATDLAALKTLCGIK